MGCTNSTTRGESCGAVVPSTRVPSLEHQECNSSVNDSSLVGGYSCTSGAASLCSRQTIGANLSTASTGEYTETHGSLTPANPFMPPLSSPTSTNGDTSEPETESGSRSGVVRASSRRSPAGISPQSPLGFEEHNDDTQSLGERSESEIRRNAVMCSNPHDIPPALISNLEGEAKPPGGNHFSFSRTNRGTGQPMMASSPGSPSKLIEQVSPEPQGEGDRNSSVVSNVTTDPAAATLDSSLGASGCSQEFSALDSERLQSVAVPASEPENATWWQPVFQSTQSRAQRIRHEIEFLQYERTLRREAELRGSGKPPLREGPRHHDDEPAISVPKELQNTVGEWAKTVVEAKPQRNRKTSNSAP